jgi:hypothetical protein
MGAYGVYPLLLQKERAAAAVRLMLVPIEVMICEMPAVRGISQNQYNEFSAQAYRAHAHAYREITF